jgi:hypothetical protein
MAGFPIPGSPVIKSADSFARDCFHSVASFQQFDDSGQILRVIRVAED